MKKIIIAIIAIATMMTLVSCKSESVTTITTHTIGEDTTTVKVWDEATQTWEVVDEIEAEHRIDDATYQYLISAYENGDIELDVLEEMLFTGTCTKY